MKEKLTRNLGVKILSVLLATLLWMVITNVNDPVRYKPFTDVPVTIKNQGIISNLNQSYEIKEGATIDFKVAARRTIIDSLSESDFEVIADFAHLSNVNSVNITITPKRYRDEIEIVDRGKVQHMIISIEELLEKEFKINVVDIGKPGAGYYIGPKSASPNIIKVKGPKSRVEKIKQVVVEVNVEDATRTVRQLPNPNILDEEGNAIDTTRLSFSHRYIEAEIEMYQIKEVELKVTAIGQPAEGYVLTGIEYQPKTIEIAAEDSKLRSINTLEVFYDITGSTDNIEDFVDLTGWIDEGVNLVSEDTTASVNVTIEKLDTKELIIWPSDIEIKNKPLDLDAVFITKGPIRVNITAPTSEIDEVTKNTLKPYINLWGYSSGTYNIDIQTDLSSRVTFNDSPKIAFDLLQQP